MDQLVIWEFTDGSVLVTTTEKEAAMLEAYKTSGWDFDEEADRTLVVADVIELRPTIRFTP